MIHTFDENLRVDGSGCLGLWLQGLLGDAILASACFEEILRSHPGRRWILVHSYRDQSRIHAVRDVLAPFLECGQIRDYVFHFAPACATMPADIRRWFARVGIEDVIEFLFDRLDRTRLSRPWLGIDLDKPKRGKAVLFRRSAWNAHFPRRNRPYDEWRAVEEAVVAKGYDAHLVGIEDDMPLTPRVNDCRGRFGVRETLIFTADASLVVSCTTFLPVFSQFVCPSHVICDPGDYENQVRNWRVTHDYRVTPAEGDYLDSLIAQIEPR